MGKEYYIIEVKRKQKTWGIDAMRAAGWGVEKVTSNYKGDILVTMIRDKDK